MYRNTRSQDSVNSAPSTVGTAAMFELICLNMAAVDKSVESSLYMLVKMVTIWIVILRVTTPCSSACGYRRFASNRCVCVQDRNVFVLDPEKGKGIFIRIFGIYLSKRAASLP
jgi:hypothetical protein